MELKNILSIVAFILTGTLVNAQIYLGKTCEIKIFSDGPIEDIDAKNTTSKPILNCASNDIAVKITIKGFDFEKELMEEHFNEKYMESDKYPYSTFTGKVNEKIDFTREGVHKVTITGKLKIHDVEKERVLEGTITVKGGEIMIESKFIVILKDHKIEIPILVAQNIAETIEVTIKSTLIEYKK
ncbi:MAG: YceI family protein [Bacteroidetes bacterium]|nr:MAG: YceI family protein [Bacteroidota bacterium]